MVDTCAANDAAGYLANDAAWAGGVGAGGYGGWPWLASTTVVPRGKQSGGARAHASLHAVTCRSAAHPEEMILHSTWSHRYNISNGRNR